MVDKPLDVVGIGNAIVDVLAHVPDSFLEENGMSKGAMTLIDADLAEKLYEMMDPAMECSGGSAANTIVGLASLGGSGAYVGKVRDDELGKVFADSIRAAGVEYDTAQAKSGLGTGRCLVFVSPDAQRTLQTYLGASSRLGPDDVDPYTISRARYTYLEGYLWDPPEAKDAFVKAARVAHEAESKVALSLSDSFCVDRHRSSFQHMVANHVDLLFANENEIVSLYQAASFNEAVATLRGRCEIAALTRGAAGSVIVTGDRVEEIPAHAVDKVVDTTGAGDLYASGFLYGLTQGREPAECARIGSIVAAHVVGHFGARPSASLAELVKRHLD